jgi:hypothetical protein
MTRMMPMTRRKLPVPVVATRELRCRCIVVGCDREAKKTEQVKRTRDFENSVALCRSLL